MEEIDAIVIDALKNIGCDLSEDVVHLKQFTPEMICNCIVLCLKTIDSNVNFTQILPQSMSLRLKLASSIVEYIKKMGFRGDIGYQTILYAPELEIRRVLMYLIERLPREASGVSLHEEYSFTSHLLKEIQAKLQLQLKQPWVPSLFFEKGAQKTDSSFLKHTFGYSAPLKSSFVSTISSNSSEAAKYYIKNKPVITAECPPEYLASTLMFNDFNCTNLNIKDLKCPVREITRSDIPSEKQEIVKVAESVQNLEIEMPKSIIKNNEKIRSVRQNYTQLHSELSKINEEINSVKTCLKDAAEEITLNKKTMAIISKEENLEKLKTMVENGKERLNDLANHWNEIQQPLLNEYQILSSQFKEQEEASLRDRTNVTTVEEKYKQLMIDLQEKDLYEKQLTKNCKTMHDQSKRSNYTKRILEIIANIRKQNQAIEKVLSDTKEVQKDLNYLNGQLDRSFTLCDEIIFKDAQRDETARKAYKLLATLHTKCEDVVKAIVALGVTERECRTLKEQVESESLKEVLINLEKVQNDLRDVRKEFNSSPNN